MSALSFAPSPDPAPAATGGDGGDANRRAVDVLARTLYGEARGESVRGKEAVAAVVINRVKKARDRGGWWWGDTIESVCLKPFQFSCWNPNDPNRAKIEAATPDDPVFACCLRIAKRAAMGALADPTGGATHYHAKSARPPWAAKKAPACTVGDHLFYDNVE